MTEETLEQVLAKYQKSLAAKVYAEANEEHDLLMNVFGISPIMKKEMSQYWGRELGMCWQMLVIEICKIHCGSRFQPAFKVGKDEPCDLVVDKFGIDTKYRIGSGDSGLHKKIRSNASVLYNFGYEPVLLILREDNLPAAITACRTGKWTIYTGDSSFDFIQKISGFDLKSFLTERVEAFPVNR